MKLCILGRQPELSLAELEARIGAQNIQRFKNAAIVDDGARALNHLNLGGTLKIAEIVAEVTSSDTETIFTAARNWVADAVIAFPEGKISIGVSAYGLRLPAERIQQFALSLKKAAKAAGRSVRVVPNKNSEMNTAQVLHNRLTDERNIELILASDGKKTIIARTISVQNIEEYSERDYGRPKRSARVGMLPPKLAQMMLNLSRVQHEQTVLDPFCGTGVVLQEAGLMGCRIYGTDLSEDMVRYTRDNIAWLSDLYRISLEKFFEVADATTHTWRPPIDFVVCETYLGKPLTQLPRPEVLEEIRTECNEITTKFLRNLASQLAPGTRCTIAVPAWATKRGFLHLPVIDQLSELGYNRDSFVHASDAELIYHRPDQIVARELLVLIRK
jgi:tRNA (guanine10-N2)-dimethyltransferase